MWERWERGLARPGGVRSRMVRSARHSATKPGEQPSGTDSFRQTAGSGQGGATVHSQSMPIPSPSVPVSKNTHLITISSNSNLQKAVKEKILWVSLTRK